MPLDRREVPPLYALTPGVREVAVLEELLQELSDAGVRWIQIREKKIPDGALSATIERVLPSLPAETVVVINDRVDLAIVTGAPAVHLGDRDLPAGTARKVLGERPMLIGVSTHSAEEAIAAALDPSVDYVALGPIFSSTTKSGREPLGLDEIARARRGLAKPLVAIGGIDASNIAATLDAGADSAAVVAALYRPGSIRDNVLTLLEACERRR